MEKAPRQSLESTRPIMAPSVRTSVRFSTYSMTPSFTPTVRTNDSVQAEISDITSNLDRMENKALNSQRVALSDEKMERMNKLALGAKLERALDRRMSSQDAEMKPRRKPALTEKKASESRGMDKGPEGGNMLVATRV